MARNVRKQGAQPEADELFRANQILTFAHGSAESLLKAYNTLGEERGRGGPSYEQQDLLRAMLMFAGAGLDACAQQVARDALPRLAVEDEDSRAALVGFTARRLKGQRADADVTTVDIDLLAEILIGDPETLLIEKLIAELTGSSLQSVEELKKVAAYLGVVQDKALAKALPDLREAFRVRNRIAHDMDIKFTPGKGRNRRPRKRDEMVLETNRLLEVAELLVGAVDMKLK